MSNADPAAAGAATLADRRAPLHPHGLRARPDKVTDITIRGGAKARGVGVGSTIAQIKAKFPRARVTHATDEVFGITLVRIPRDGGGKFQFGVDVDTGKTTVIGIPRIGFCE